MTNTQTKISATFQDNEARATLIMLDVTFMRSYNIHRSGAGKVSEIKTLKASEEYHRLHSLKAVARICLVAPEKNTEVTSVTNSDLFSFFS